MLKALYIGGATLDDAAANCDPPDGGISRNTASQWRRADEEMTGVSWDDLRQQAASDAAKGNYTPEKLAEKFGQALGWLLDNQSRLLPDDPKGFCDALSKAQANYLSMIDLINDPTRIQTGLFVLAKFARERCSEAECELIGSVVDRMQSAIRDEGWRVMP